MVADCEFESIQVLSLTLTHLSDISFPEHELDAPWFIYLDELSGRLYVGERWSGSAFIVLSASEWLQWIGEIF